MSCMMSNTPDAELSASCVPRACQKSHWAVHKGQCGSSCENVGLPFLVSVPQSRLTYSRLTQLLEGYSR